MHVRWPAPSNERTGHPCRAAALAAEGPAARNGLTPLRHRSRRHLGRDKRKIQGALTGSVDTMLLVTQRRAGTGTAA